MSVIALLLTLTAIEPPVDLLLPDFSVSVSGVKIPIRCDVNDFEIEAAEQSQIDLINTLTPLRQARLEKALSEEQSKYLFQAELLLAGMEQVVAAHNLGTFYCAHRDKIPKTEAIRQGLEA